MNATATATALDFSELKLDAKLTSRDFAELKGFNIHDFSQETNLRSVTGWELTLQDESIDEDGSDMFLRFALKVEFTRGSAGIWDTTAVLWISEAEGFVELGEIPGDSGMAYRFDAKKFEALFRKLNIKQN